MEERILELERLLQQSNEAVCEMKIKLQMKEERIVELTSQLDKYLRTLTYFYATAVVNQHHLYSFVSCRMQSVFHLSQPGIRASAAPTLMRRKVRAQGISAEPLKQEIHKDLIQEELNVYPKSDW